MAGSRILYHHRTLGDGGEGIHIAEMVRALRGLNHEVRVVSPVGETTNDSPRASIASRWNHLRRLIPSSLYEFAEIAYNVVALRRLMQAARSFHPDFVYDRYSSYSTAALRTARRLRVPLLLEVNAPLVFERTNYEHLRLRWPWLAARYETFICHGADRIFTVSHALKDYLIQQRDLPSDRIEVLPNAINPDKYAHLDDGSAIRRKHGLGNDVVVGFVGTLRTWHGIDLLMQAIPEVLNSCDNCRFLIVGYGELEETFRNYIQGKQWSQRVTFTGRAPHPEIPKYIAAMDITLMPNSNFYGSPIKVFEYMASGKPTIAPRLGPLEEIIEDGVNGILIASGSSSALVNAIRALIADKTRRERIGEEARRNVLRSHTWKRNAELVVEAYGKIREAGHLMGSHAAT